ncbi:sensor histidine kinase [Selenomonas sp. KH1T6]|uniref:sensor histidine kinase n=1 Tax=Selenomonas sp. KH1T6 TaxID=3158784 RepID=UPI0008A72EDB|nr:Signal transduction histidine kinase [Selenomonas ruminantium]
MMEIDFFLWRSLFKTKSLAGRLHQLLWLYNGMVVVLFSGFYYVTQHKIIEAMTARSFLQALPVLPLPADEVVALSWLSFGVLFVCGRIYHRQDITQSGRYLALLAETIACLVVMRTLSLAYDGLVLLVVADLMHRYDGKNTGGLLVGAMLLLFFLADYNMLGFLRGVEPFDAYAAYYNSSVRGVLSALKSGLSSVNVVLFALYLVMLIQNKHQEKERIQSLNEQLESANEKLRLYAAEAERTAETRERNRLAREIHDTLGHTLTGLAAGMDACMVLVDVAPQKAKEQMEKLRDVAKHGLKDVRRSVKKLRPDDLERLPLREALTHMVKEYADTTSMEVKLSIEGWPEAMRQDVEEVIYRIVQEGLTNANRHGHATKASVTFQMEEGRLTIAIVDNGQGCKEAVPGFGLRHMQERLDLLHGSLSCQSDKGFKLEAVIPVGQGAKEERHD